MDRRALWTLSFAAIAIFAVGIRMFEGGSAVELSRSPPSGEGATTMYPPVLAPDPKHERIEADIVRESADSHSGHDETHTGPGITLVVVDSDGLPLPDLPIAWGLARDSRADGCPPYRASTDREGRVHFDASEIHALNPKDSKEILRFTFVSAFDVPCWIERSVAEAEVEAVELRLPPMATVFVDVHSAGFPLAELAEVLLEVRANSEIAFSPHSRVQLRLARATFPLVPIGWEVRATASHRGITVATSTEPPAIAIRGGGPPLRIDFPPIAIFSFRVVTHEGLPLSDTGFTITRVGSADVDRAHSNGATDALGRTSIVWPISTEDEPIASLRIDTQSDSYRGSAEVMVGDRIVAGTVDLGDVWLRPPAILAAGRVLDTDGRPLAHALIVASVLRLAPSGRRGDRHLEDATVARTQTDEYGSFEIRYDRAEPSIRLLVWTESIAPDVFTVPTGSMGLDLRLPSRASIAGSLDSSHRDSVALDEIIVSLLPGDSFAATSSKQTHRRALIDARGAFQFDGLAPGKYQLAISYGSDSLKSTQYELNVVAGETLRDPRVQGIKLEP